MIKITDKIFELHTDNTSYIFRVAETGHLEHLYYGPRLFVVSADDVRALAMKVPFPPGNTIVYDEKHPGIALEDMCLEMSAPGKGDIREPFTELVHADGSRTCDFLFDGAEILPDKAAYETLPGSYGLKEGGHLCVTLKEALYGLILELHYYVYEECDVICRSSKLINSSDAPVRIERLMSMQLDLPDSGYIMTTFTGAWAREMERTDTLVSAARCVVSSSAGSSSNRANPFFMLSRPETCEETGACYGVNLIYSGNHFGAAEVNLCKKTRVLCGINPRGFEYLLEPGECFEAPEAVITYSAEGFGKLSRSMHSFIRKHIIRGNWKDKLRPVLLNSWEAFYFNFNETRLLKLAKEAKEAGIELFVIDDGWFGKRDNDKSSLGDWYANRKKLPGGLAQLAEKINRLGLDFGIWVEPEMVSVDSDLYRAHPDWAVDIPGAAHSEGRNQRVLDLANPQVVSWLDETLSGVFSSANISYVKWDMNRIFSDAYSKYLQPGRQGEFAHRYMIGLYRLLESLTKKFPDILFEGCASGGGRFDLGMLCYFPQIWGSDNTDPVCRAEIQENYSYGYPLSCISAHVSASPNHQTLRKTPLLTRFNVAAFGILGYECNLLDMEKEELKEIRGQIKLYKKKRYILQTGDFYRNSRPGLYSWTAALPSGEAAVSMLLQELAVPGRQQQNCRVNGLKPDASYHFYNIPVKYDIRDFGGLVNAVLPVHIKEGSPLHEAAAKFVKLPGEKEDYIVSGCILENSGVWLSGAFTATGISGNVRLFQDFASRMYFTEEEDD